MGQEISLFSGYNVRENRLTNYTLLVIKLLYEDSPALYQSFLAALLPEAPISALPKFEQQKHKKASVPDGFIEQMPYTIYLETKDSDWFYDDQLRAHLRALGAETSGGVRALIALCPFAEMTQDKLNQQYRAEAAVYGPDVRFRALSFAELLDCFPDVGAESFIARVLGEYEAYLQTEDLLGSWQNWLDVVNCATWPEHFIDHQVYSCPVKGANYSHKRCKYLGLYKDKIVSQIALVRGVVELYLDGRQELLWSNDGTSKQELFEAGLNRVERAWGEKLSEDLRVFVLGDPNATQFEKTTKGSMRGSKQYFDIAKLEASDAPHLAEKLHGLSWSALLEPALTSPNLRAP